jgi:hypothetical protein
MPTFLDMSRSTAAGHLPKSGRSSELQPLPHRYYPTRLESEALRLRPQYLLNARVLQQFLASASDSVVEMPRLYFYHNTKTDEDVGVAVVIYNY